jgi:flagellar basal-body rod protein FlgC
MGFFDAIDIAATGLTAERLRLDVTAENLANAQTTRTATGGPYQRKEVVLQQGGGFGTALAGAMGASGGSAGIPTEGATGGPGFAGVQVAGVVNDPSPDKLVYDPGHPDANAQGYVRMPNVNSVTEMVDLIDESRSYEADVTAMQTAKTMVSQTLNLLK